MPKHASLPQLLWAYVSEILLASFLTVFIWLVVPSDSLSNFIMKTTGKWTTILVGLGGIAAAALIAFYATVQTDFGVWLRHKQSFEIYSLAFSFPLIAYVFSLLFFLLLDFLPDSRTLCLLALWLMFYSIILLVTLLKNFYEFVALGLLFRECMRNAEAHSQQDKAK